MVQSRSLKILKPFVNLIFYSNVWIALCASAMVLQTQYVLTKRIEFSPLLGLVFFSTLALYAVHRIVGLGKMKPFTDKGRFKVIESFKSHISIYAGLASLAAIYFFLQTSWAVKWALIIPALISSGYVLPIFGKRKRLRDFNGIKIFLVAIIWAWVTVLLPFMALDQTINTTFWLLFMERSCFIFAITLPFDIRDLKVDMHTKVKTIPIIIGVKNTKILAGLILSFFIIIVTQLMSQSVYDLLGFTCMTISAISTYQFILISDKIKHDYYFTGLMDGTMILQFSLLYIVQM